MKGLTDSDEEIDELLLKNNAPADKTGPPHVFTMHMPRTSRRQLSSSQDSNFLPSPFREKPVLPASGMYNYRLSIVSIFQ